MNINRYEFYKRLFPDKLILYIDDGKLSSIGVDRDILNIGNITNISRVIVDREDNVEIIESDENLYYHFLLRVSLYKIVEKMVIGKGTVEKLCN